VSTESEVRALARYFYEVGHLKHSKRTGWWVAGVKDPESVAEHSFRTAVIGYVLAKLEGADPAKTVLLCLFHDVHETRVGDIPHMGRRYLEEAPPVDVVGDQVAGLPGDLSNEINAITNEYETRESTESELAHDADKLECLVQAMEYQTQGNEYVVSWADTSEVALKSVSAKRLAAACRETPPAVWWRQIDEVLRRQD
jgi:putative hydrolase of HD superfamily